MDEEKVAGVILSPPRAGLKKLADYCKYGPPVVLFDRKMPDLGIDYVVIDIPLKGVSI